MPQVTQQVSYKTRINSRSSDSNLQIISTTPHHTGCEISTVLFTFFIFVLFKTVVLSKCPKTWAFLSVGIIARAPERKDHGVSELRKVESREWQGWSNLGSDLLLNGRPKSCRFMSLWRSASNSLLQDCFLDHGMIIIFYT